MVTIESSDFITRITKVRSNRIRFIETDRRTGDRVQRTLKFRSRKERDREFRFLVRDTRGVIGRLEAFRVR